ncbi:hypothetical protein SK128_011765 [Halocaridina rubra]|uniref:Nuclear receptor coactivator 4 n=1 Tax=Halocaridina rubra TaxID=373956 RepID=A0AAN9A1K1_HALRR
MSLEKLKQETSAKLALVDRSITQVDSYRKQLQENALKIKEEIHEAVERQVGSLRGRERQLVRQVEVVTAHQTCLLNTQQAGLMHSQGALTATNNILQQCTPSDVSTLSKIKMDDIPSLGKVKPVNMITVHLKESNLKSSIQGFGHVQLPDTITHHPSPVIPVKLEEYEDEDHDVLYKSVAGSVTGAEHITVQFPRLSHQNWLMRQKEKNIEFVHEAKIPAYNKKPSNCDVSSWLSNLRIDEMQDGEDNEVSSGSIGSFDLVSNGAASSTRSSESSSIEIVPSHFESEKDDCSAVGSTCEIETLPLCLKEKSRWLSPQHSATMPLLQQIQVSEACQANEKCSDFSECVCQGSCIDVALQKAQQTAEYQSKISRKRTLSQAEATDSVLAHMANILSSDNSIWLMKGHDVQSCLPKPAKRALYAEIGEKWLSHPTSSNSPSSRLIPLINVSAHSNIWLLHKLKAEKISKDEKMESDTEKTKDEKESSRITTEDLSEALRKVRFDAANLDLRNFYAAKKVCHYAKEPSDVLTDESWLASKAGEVKQSVDNRLQENDITNKEKWLACSSLRKLNVMRREENLPSRLPDAVLALADADLKQWLVKRL